MYKSDQQIKNPFKFGKIVHGDDFCNRTKEIKTLKKNIHDGYSVWLFSPRRFGKTSLLLKAFEETPEVKCLYFDLYNVQTVDDFCRKYARLLAKELFNWKDNIKDLTSNLAGYFKNMFPVISFDQNGMPSFSLQAATLDKQQEIETLLNIPEQIALKKNLKFCIALDEFQETERIHKFLVHWMRSAFQNHHSVSYIFLGSKPSMMKSIFTSKNSPFYEFAVKMEIGKISKPDFVKFINDKFNEVNLEIKDNTINQILEVSEGHPHFTQYFASVVFDLIREGEDQNAVNFKNKWIELVLNSQSMSFQNIYDQLNSNQRKTLTAIALTGNESEIFSTETGRKYSLPASSTLTIALKSLIKKDLIGKTSKGYEILNPVFRLWIEEISKN